MENKSIRVTRVLIRKFLFSITDNGGNLSWNGRGQGAEEKEEEEREKNENEAYFPLQVHVLLLPLVPATRRLCWDSLIAKPRYFSSKR